MANKVSDIKEVLHLYYGCDVEHEDDFCALTRFKLDGRMIDRWNDNCVLLLRSLNTMTDEEAVELCKAYYPEPFLGHTRYKWNIERQSVGKHKPNEYIVVSHPKNHYSFSIDFTDGCVTLYRDGELTTMYLQAVCFLYLLRKGFDLFELIPRKLAQKWTPEPLNIVD